ncbi:MAG: DUF6596 domain-containing protein [Actinomycetota bacterium]
MTEHLDSDDAHRAARDAARTSYGRLVALVAAQIGDVAAAEDALSDAFEAALRTWPARGVPDSPDAWLLTTARRRAIDEVRRSSIAQRAQPALALLADEHLNDDHTGAITDKRLELLFACAHPAIEPRVRTPLMLQVVLGLDVARMASAFLVAPSTLGQRLVRAKRKIRDAGIGFRIPDADELPDRLDAVLDAIYGGYTAGRAGDDPPRAHVTTEAIRLTRVVNELLPEHPETLGLMALVLYTEARRPAARDVTGRFVPLAEQDTTQWDEALVDEADAALSRAARAGFVGPFGLEAHIQSVHMQRRHTGSTDWRTIRGLYDTLLLVSPTVGARVAAAGAALEADGPEAALRRLDEVADEAAAYQPWWAVRGHALRRLGDGDAHATLQRAAGMTDDAAVRSYLLDLADR